MKTNPKFTPEQEAALRRYGKKPGGWLIDGPKVPRFSPVCDRCIYLQQELRCDAFPAPQSIPLEIWLGQNPHTEPFPGDHDIRFEAVNQTECQPDIIQVSSEKIGESKA